MLNVTELKNGTIYEENIQPWQVIKYEHIKVSRGSANVKVKVRNLITDQVLEKTYFSTAKVNRADVQTKNAQYLYKDSNGYIFMDPETYEQMSVSARIIGQRKSFLKEGQKVLIQYFNDNPINIDLPNTMDFKITYTEPGYKGNTVNNVYKDAEIETGAKVKVPAFIKIGDKIKVDTRSGEYVSKA